MEVQSTATNGCERAIAEAVDHARDQFFARAGFAFDHHGGIGRRDLRDTVL